MLSKSAAEEDAMANLIHLFQTMPVYSVPLPPTDAAVAVPPAKDKALLYVAQPTHGLVSTAGQLPAGAPELNFATRKIEEEQGEILPLLPPPMPDLGVLRRFDTGTSMPLTGEALKQLRPKVCDASTLTAIVFMSLLRCALSQIVTCGGYLCSRRVRLLRTFMSTAVQ